MIVELYHVLQVNTMVKFLCFGKKTPLFIVNGYWQGLLVSAIIRNEQISIFYWSLDANATTHVVQFRPQIAGWYGLILVRGLVAVSLLLLVTVVVASLASTRHRNDSLVLIHMRNLLHGARVNMPGRHTPKLGRGNVLSAC